MTWLGFWTVVLVAVGVGFAAVAVLVAIRGASDLRRLLGRDRDG